MHALYVFLSVKNTALGTASLCERAVSVIVTVVRRARGTVQLMELRRAVHVGLLLSSTPDVTVPSLQCRSVAVVKESDLH